MHDIDSQGPECAPSSPLWRPVLDPDAGPSGYFDAKNADGPDAISVYLWARVAYRTGSVSEGAWLSATAYSILYPLSSLGRVQVFDGDAGEWRDVAPPSDPDT